MGPKDQSITDPSSAHGRREEAAAALHEHDDLAGRWPSARSQYRRTSNDHRATSSKAGYASLS